MTDAPVPLAEQIAFVESEIGHWRDEVEIQHQHPVCIAQVTKLEAVLATLQQHERLQADYEDTVTCLNNERRIWMDKLQQHERAMAALRYIEGTAHLSNGGFVISGTAMNQVRDVLRAAAAVTTEEER